MNFTIEAMRIDDFDAVAALWKGSEGVGFNEMDTRPCIASSRRPSACAKTLQEFQQMSHGLNIRPAVRGGLDFVALGALAFKRSGNGR